MRHAYTDTNTDFFARLTHAQRLAYLRQIADAHAVRPASDLLRQQSERTYHAVAAGGRPHHPVIDSPIPQRRITHFA